MSDPFVRSITFTIAATATSPAIQITAVETSTGTLQFTIDVLSTSKLTGDLRGLFFDFNRDPLLSGLKVSGSNITAFDTIDVTNLGNGVTMQSAGAPYDVGVAFGTASLGKDDIKHQTFTLYDPLHALTLDDIANVEFGVRLTSVGSPTGSRTGSSKLVTVASAAPDAKDDSYAVFEDGQSGLDHPATHASPVVFQVLANDTDADHNTLLITAIDTPGHGSLAIVDGDDADTAPGDALRYTPNTDFSGADQFRYAISDGHGGTDFAWVHVDVAAVADVPQISYSVRPGPLVNQIIIEVTTSPTDSDGSEYISDITFSGLPGGMTVAPLDYTPFSPDSSQPQQIIRHFLLTLPPGETSDFDLTISSTATERANGDTESNSVHVPISMVATDTLYHGSFQASDRSLWGESASPDFDNEHFFGVDEGIHEAANTFIGYDFTASFKAGLQTEVHFSNGVIDAELDYDIDVQTQYNHTTDVLQISSSEVLTGGGFSTEGMQGSINYAAVLNYFLHAAITYNLGADIAGDIFGVTIQEEHTFPLFNLDSDALSTPVQVSNELGSVYISWPDTSTTSSPTPPPTDEFSANGDQLDFATLGIDIDALLGLPFHFPINIPGILSVDIDLADIDFVSDFDFLQKLVMQAQGLQVLLQFENGILQPYVLGTDLLIQNASEIDAGGDNDGTVDFQLWADPQATLANHTSLDLNLGVTFKALTVTGSYNVIGIVSGDINVGPVYGPVTAMASTPPLEVFNDEFALDFVGQTFDVSA